MTGVQTCALPICRKQGLQLGREEGLKLGRVDAEKELVGNKQSLETLCKSLLNPIDEQHEELEQVLLNTTLALVRAVIHTETKQNPDLIKAALSKCLESLPKNSSELSIQLHPSDHLIVAPLISQIAPGAKVTPNGTLVRGGCVVESSQQVLDYTIEKRFQLAVQKMLMDVAEKASVEVHQESPKTLQSHTEYPSQVLEQGIKTREQHGSGSETAIADEKDTDEMGVDQGAIETDIEAKSARDQNAEALSKETQTPIADKGAEDD